MLKHLLSLWLIGALLTAGVQGAEQAPAKKTLDTSFIASDSFVVIVIHPRQMLAQTPKHSKFVKMMISLVDEESGIQIDNLEQIVVQFGVPEGEDDDIEDKLVVTMRFAKDVDRARIREKTFTESREAVHDGKKYMRAERDSSPSGYFHDDRTLIMAKEKRLLKVMAQKQSMGPLVHRLRSIDATSDIVIVGNFHADAARAATQELANEMFDQDLPPELVGALDAGTLTAKLSSDIPIRMQLDMADEKAALGVKKWSESLLTIGRRVFPELKKEILRDLPSPLDDSLVDAIDKLLNETQVSVEGNRVHAVLHAKGGLPQVVEVFTFPFVVFSGAFEEDADVTEPEVKDADAPDEPADTPRPKK